MSDNSGQPILDQLHALQSGVVEAVKALDDICSQDYLTTGRATDHPVAIASLALATLRPLVTPKEEGK